MKAVSVIRSICPILGECNHVRRFVLQPCLHAYAYSTVAHPYTPHRFPAILAKQVSYMESDKGWVLKVVPEAQDLPGDGSLTLQDVSRGVGTVGLWEGEWKGTAVTEICWGIAPKFKGRKFGKMAVSLLLDMARADGRWGVIHVFTTVTNVASNALCVSCGFKYEGQETVDYDGRDLFTNHYTLDTAQQALAL
jgi:RimJ/RimL family protein N-acetyltransferase